VKWIGVVVMRCDDTGAIGKMFDEFEGELNGRMDICGGFVLLLRMRNGRL
jgi:hypothetical protein